MSDNSHKIRTDLEAIWRAGVEAVGGYRCVSDWLKASKPDVPSLILSVGKAAEQMYLAADDFFGGDIPSLIATKYGHISKQHDCQVFCAGHPTPDENSLKAGHALLESVKRAGPQDRLLMLVSGGASAIAEALQPGDTLDALQARNDAMLADGVPIAAINSERKKHSLIKGGKLLAACAGAEVTTLAISDVEGDSLDIVGSGIGGMAASGQAAFHGEVVASNSIARAGAAETAARLGYQVRGNLENLYCDIGEAAESVAAAISGEGVYIFGGEPTVQLPDNPGMGGRNQALALELAKRIAGRNDLHLLVAGTDGTDGPTEAAGALVDGALWQSGAENALARADSYHWLAKQGALFETGPTGTNVMDLVVAIKA